VQIAVILSCVAAIVFGQILFKIVALELRTDGFAGLLVNAKAAALFIFALLLYAAATFAWIWVLRVVPLGRAYLFMSLSFAAVPLLAHYVLGENLSPGLLAGSALIVTGVLVTARSL
jgi:drug/metabolite transporter (DMT)-like permease